MISRWKITIVGGFFHRNYIWSRQKRKWWPIICHWREIVAILIMRKKVFFMNFLAMVNSQQHYTSALVTVQAKLKEETDKETIWIVETCSCWKIVACSWIINWGADSRIASNIPSQVSSHIKFLIFFSQSSSNVSCHNFLKFLEHKINACNRL